MPRWNCGEGAHTPKAAPPARDVRRPSRGILCGPEPGGSLARTSSRWRLYFLKTPDGKTVELSESDLRRRIDSGKVRAWDHLSSDGEVFIQIRGRHEFAEEFADAAVDLTDYCTTHSKVVAAVRCLQCGRGYCTGCRPDEDVEHTNAKKCPACTGLLTEFESRSLAPHFWQQPFVTLRYPLAERSWIITLGVAFLLWGGRLIPPFTLTLYFLGMAYVVHAVASSARGRTTMGYGPDVEDIWAMVARGFVACLVLVALALPFIVLNFYAIYSLIQGGKWWLVILLNFPLAVFAWAYYPMALAISSIWQHKWIAFQPHVVIQHVLMIPLEYGAVLAGCLVLLMFERMIGTFLSIALLPFGLLGLTGVVLGFFVHLILGEFVDVYFILVGAHMIGRTMYKCESKLGWED